MSRFDEVLSKKMCLGCGLCESIGKNEGYKMQLSSNGFYNVVPPDKRNLKFENEIENICPSINIYGSGEKSLWGPIKHIYKAHSTDEDIRFQASSGGVITSACTHLIKTKQVDAVMHVGNSNDQYLHNILKISITKEDILSNSSSRYAPAIVFSNIVQILEKDNFNYVFVGKPCDILGIKNFLFLYPQYELRFKLFISIFCAGMPSYKATETIINSFNVELSPKSVRYRGNGWPGEFTVDYGNNIIKKISYINSWNNYLGRNLHFRCKICPDSIGTIADISVGDAWETEKGFIDFTDRMGESCVITRTDAGDLLIKHLFSESLIEGSEIGTQQLNLMQPNHIRKRVSSGYKLLILSLSNPKLFRVRKIKLLYLMSKYNILKGLRDIIGVIKRYNKWIKYDN